MTTGTAKICLLLMALGIEVEPGSTCTSNNLLFVLYSEVDEDVSVMSMYGEATVE